MLFNFIKLGIELLSAQQYSHLVSEKSVSPLNELTSRLFYKMFVNENAFIAVEINGSGLPTSLSDNSKVSEGA